MTSRAVDAPVDRPGDVLDAPPVAAEQEAPDKPAGVPLGLGPAEQGGVTYISGWAQMWVPSGLRWVEFPLVVPTRNCAQKIVWVTNAFSQKLENHEHAIALHYMVYNFARRHQTTRVTPAMAAGVDRRLWTMEDIVRLSG